jgi:paraquat-inducible protein B
MHWSRRWSLWAGLVPVVGLAAGAMFATSRAASQGTDLRSDVSSLSDLVRKQTSVNRTRQARVGTVQREVDDLTRRARPEVGLSGRG